MFVAKIQGQKVEKGEVRCNFHVEIEVWENGKMVDRINGKVEDWNNEGQIKVRLAKGSEFVDDACNGLVDIQL